MIFQLGKVKPLTDRTVEAETLRRWREVSLGDDLVVDESEKNEDWRISNNPQIYEDEKTFTLGNSSSARDVSTGSRSVNSQSIHQQNTDTLDQPTLDDDLKRRFGGNLRSALGPGTVIEGKFSFDSPVRIDGTLIGEVNSTSALIVGEHASVNATIRVGSIIILGKVSGPIEASELVEIRATGELEGNIRTQRLAMQEGGRFNGACSMGAGRQALLRD